MVLRYLYYQKIDLLSNSVQAVLVGVGEIDVAGQVLDVVGSLEEAPEDLYR